MTDHDCSAFWRLAMVLFLMGCGGGSATGGPVLAEWAVGSAPILRIGDEAHASSQFGSIRGILQLPSGEIVVADGATSELRRFGMTGGFLGYLARRGNGPGELSAIEALTLQGDTMFVWDRTSPIGRGIRVHRYTTSGFLRRTDLRVSNAPFGMRPVAQLSTGEMVVTWGGGFRPVSQSLSPGTLQRDSTRVGVLALAADSVVWSPPVPSHTFLWYAADGLAGGSTLVRYPFQEALVVGASGDRIWIGDPRSGTIVLLASFHDTTAVIDLTAYRRPMSAQALQRARDRTVGRALNDVARRGQKAVYARAENEAMAPVFRRLLPGTNGEMWVELFDEEETTPRRMLVLDYNGTPVATASTPPGFLPYHIGLDHLIGVRTDDDDRESVFGYRLTRHGRAPVPVQPQ